MGRQLDYLVKCVYEGEDLETLKEAYKPFEIDNVKDTIFHLLAKNAAGKPSIKLAKALREFKWAKPESAEFLRTFGKQGGILSEKRIRKYKLQKDTNLAIAGYQKECPDENDLDTSYKYGSGVFYDGQFSFCLEYSGELCAFAAFSPETNKLVVKQIQGRKNKENPLLPLDWPAAFLSLITRFAKENEIKEVEVMSVLNNQWANLAFKKLQASGVYVPAMTIEDATRMTAEEEKSIRQNATKNPNICYTDIHLMPRQGFLIYDTTAQKLGFEKNSQGNYVLKTADCHQTQIRA